MINFEDKKVLFIDLDSTLIKTISGKTFPEDITDFRIQLPVLNKCDYFVDDVIILDKNFSKIGDIVKGTNKTAPHDTLYVKIVK